MIEQEEYSISNDQLVANIEEMVRAIDGHVKRIKEMLSSNEITHYEDRALFYAMNLMLKERKELMEAKERAMLGALSEQAFFEDAS